jgi:hypothetical protein
MDSTFAALAAAGATKADLIRALTAIRIDTALVHALRELRSSNIEARRVRLVIVSDANAFFIQEVGLSV